MAANIQRTDLYVGLFLIATVGLVVGALVATSGWGVDRYEIYVRTNDARDLTADTKVFMQGLEVGRVSNIAPRPAGERLEFIVALSLLDRFPDGTPLRLPKETIASVQTGVFGGSTLELTVDTLGSGGTLGPADTIRMERHAAAMEAFAGLANDLKGTIQTTLTAATAALYAAQRLADSLALAASTGRRVVADLHPDVAKVLANVGANLDRMQLLIDSTTVRTGGSVQHVNALLEQARVLLVSGDSLTRLFIAMGAESRPEVRSMLVNMRQISEQLQFVLEQLGRRPMRAITGVKIPDSLTIEGRAARDAAAAADSARPQRDSVPAGPPPAAPRAPARPSGMPSPAPADTTTRRP